MSIMQRIRKGVKVRFSEKGKNKISQQIQNPTSTKSKKKELYTSNEDLGYC